MSLTFDEVAAIWVRGHYPNVNPVVGSVSFEAEYDMYDTDEAPYTEVSWNEERPIVTGFDIVKGRPVPRSDGTKTVQVYRKLDIELNQLISEIIDLALKGTSSGALRQEVRKPE